MTTTDRAPANFTEFPIPISADYPVIGAGLAVGEVIRERYRVGERIGGGGMADVFCAHDGWLHRDVAIKVIKPALASREMCRRMEQEGRAAAAIDHPNLLRVLDIGMHGRTVYLVTELLHGCSLGELLRERPDGRLDWRAALELLIPALEALHLVHQAGYIHRDLKPDNLFFHRDDRGDRLIVLDLGIAKLAPARQGARAPYHTETGRVLGTPAYMSPEQASGLPVDHRTDIYSIGVTLHRMLAGRLPFEPKPGDQPFQLMTRNLYDDPPRLDEQALQLPPSLADQVLMMLAKAPAQRPRSMRVLAEQLADIKASGEAPRPSNHAGRVPRVGRVAPVMALAAGTAIFGALLLSPAEWSSAEPPDASSTPAPAPAPVRSEPPAPSLPLRAALPATVDLAEERTAVPDVAVTSPAPVPAPAARPAYRRASAIAVVFAGAGPEVAKCLRRYGDLDIPELRVRLALASDGSVTRTELVNNRLLVSLHRCVRPALLRMQFAPGPAQEVEYSYSNVADG